MTDPATLLELARGDLAAFAALFEPHFELAHHTAAIVDVLERVERGDERRVILDLPPRHGKSLLASVMLPAWYLGRHPERFVIAASHSQELTDMFGRHLRAIARDPRFRALFPAARVREDSAAVSRFDLETGGGFYGVGRGGSLTGRGGHLIVVDDAIKDYEEAHSPAVKASVREWWRSVLYPRLAPGAAIVVIGSRWALDDLPGWLREEHSEDGWRLVHMPAIAEADEGWRKEGEPLWPSKYPLEALLRIREQLGSEAFGALYQGRPVPRGGAVFKSEWLRFYGEPPERFDRTIIAADTAFGKSASSGDYTVAQVWGSTPAGYFLLHVLRERFDFPTLKAALVELSAAWRPDALLVEDAASGQSLLQALREETLLPLKPIKPDRDKLTRAAATTALFEAGRVLVPERAGWLQAFLDELLSFPHGAYDDQVDALTMALGYLREHSGGFLFERGIVPPRSPRDEFWKPPDDEEEEGEATMSSWDIEEFRRYF